MIRSLLSCRCWFAATWLLGVGWSIDHFTGRLASAPNAPAVPQAEVLALSPAPPQSPPTQPSLSWIDQARTWLHANQVDRAAESLRQAWARSSQGRDKIAFYLALCCEARRDFDASRLWYEEAYRLSSKSAEGVERSRIYEVRLDQRRAPIQVVSAKAVAATREHAEPGDLTEAQMMEARNRLESAEKALKGAQQRLKEKQEKGGTSDEIFKAKIVYASWLFLYGELASDPALGRRRLVTLGNDHFDVAKSSFKEALSDKDKTDQKIEQLCSDDLFAMHWDMLKVRYREEVQKNEEFPINLKIGASRQREKNRLKALRDLTNSYKACTEQANLALTYLLLKDYDKAKPACEQMRAAVDKIKKDVDSLTKLPGDDYFVKADEKTDLSVPEGPEYQLFSKSFVPLMESITAWMDLRGLDQAAASPKLAEMKKKLEDAVKEAAEGDKLLPNYVLGLAWETEGIDTIRKTPADRAGAQKAFDAAKTAFTSAQGLLPKAANPADPQTKMAALDQELKARLAVLNEPARFRKHAARLIESGRPDQAADVLTEGILRNGKGALWLERAQARLWARQDAAMIEEELKPAFDSKLLDKDSPQAQLVLGKLTLARVEKDANAASKAAEHFKAAIDRLPKAGKLSQADKQLEAACRSYRAFALAQASQRNTAEADTLIINALVEANQPEPFFQSPEVAPLLKLEAPPVKKKTDADKKDEKKAEAFDLRELFFKASGAADLLDPQATDTKTVSSLGVRESFVINRLAYGLAVAQRKLEGDYATAAGAYGQALDQEDSLPFASPKRGYNSYLVATLNNNSDQVPIDKFNDESKQRRVLAHFAQGLMALQVGESFDAAGELDKALEFLHSDPPPQKSVFDPATLFEADLSSDLLAFKAFSDLQKCRVERDRGDLQKRREIAADAWNKLSNTPSKQLQKGKQRVSPLELLARGLVEEEYMATRADLVTGKRKELTDGAKKNLNDFLELMKAPDYRKRYPVYDNLCKQALRRLKDESVFLEAAKRLRDAYRISDAVQELNEGRLRHPDNPALLHEWADLNVNQAFLIDPKKAGESLELLQKLDKGFVRSYGEGQIYERLENWEKAIETYDQAEKAATAAENPEAIIRATSMRSGSTARLGTETSSRPPSAP